MRSSLRRTVRRRNWALHPLALALVLCVPVVFADETETPPYELPPAPAVEPAPSDEEPAEIVQDDPSFLVHVYLDRDDCLYREGEELHVTIVTEQDAYCYLLYEQADGSTALIFPNSAQPEHLVKANEEVAIPAEDDRFTWRIGPPFGKERLRLIASKDPIRELEDPELRRARFNPVEQKQIAAVAKSLQPTKGEEAAPQWAEDYVDLTTFADDADRPAETGNRYGVFFGIAHFEFNGVLVDAFGEEAGPDRPGANSNNAIVMEELMRRVGKLDESQVFINEEATRQQMETSICEWLPSVSKPGDTVFIFFCGHGSQVKDDDGDEADGLDEWLTPYDYADLGTLAALLELDKKSALSPEMEPKLAELLEIVRGTGSEERAERALINRTGITDDQLGHWLQRLAGRRVVVILESCHSGGQATHEKGLDPADRVQGPEPLAIDVLDSEVGRLKDLGQTGTILFAACSKDQSAYCLRVPDAWLEEIANETKGIVDEWEPELELGVMTYYFVESLLKGERPLPLEQVFQRCEQGMAAYFQNYNELREKRNEEPLTPHAPVYVNYSDQPVIVKP